MLLLATTESMNTSSPKLCRVPTLEKSIALPLMPRQVDNRVPHQAEKRSAISSERSVTESERSRKTEQISKPWKPVTLHPCFLLCLILATCALITVIQWLVTRSQQQQGLLFAKDIASLPLHQSFGYLYFPTIISVIYSSLWAWVDLDVKRLEPWFQMSEPGGADASNSVLLEYPFQFMATIPYKSLKRRHWPVFIVSLIMILILWGLTPIQAGMFAVRTVIVHKESTALYSTTYASKSPGNHLTALSAQSVYNIAWLNESLPPFMTRDFILSAFGDSNSPEVDGNDVMYTARTMLYSVDLSCEELGLLDLDKGWYETKDGCHVEVPPIRPTENNDTSKAFDTTYIGQDGFEVESWYIYSSCGKPTSPPFFVRWAKSSPEYIRSGNASERSSLCASTDQVNMTSLYCTPFYYQQMVNATIRLPSKSVVGAEPLAAKAPLPSGLFNVSMLAAAMSSAKIDDIPTRGDFPIFTFPDQKQNLITTPINLADIPKMSQFAIGSFPRPAEDYLHPEILRTSYQSAYRLLFARQLAGVLAPELDPVTSGTGQLSYTTEAVVIISGFAYAAIVLLSLIACGATSLLTCVSKRRNNLQGDPATIGALMDMLLGCPSTVKSFTKIERSSSKRLTKLLEGLEFYLEKPGDWAHMAQLRARESRLTRDSYVNSKPGLYGDADQEINEMSGPGVRPKELHLIVGLAFVCVQMLAAVLFLVVFLQARRADGIPLPTESTFPRQLVENYLPILFGTLIEPLWLVFTRQISLLAPFDRLRIGSAHASKTVHLDFCSLPPATMLWRALQTRHSLLVPLCVAALSANVLTVALGGLLYEATKEGSTSREMPVSKASRFVSLNGTGMPFNQLDYTSNQANQGGTTSDQFYRVMSNLTAGTPLPPWTDEDYAYWPIDIVSPESTTSYQVRTQAIGATLICQDLQASGTTSYQLDISCDSVSFSLNTTLDSGHGGEVQCSPSTGLLLSGVQPQHGRLGLEFVSMLDQLSALSSDGITFCRQYFLADWTRADWEESARYERQAENCPTLSSRNDTTLLCKTALAIGPAEVIVNGNGNVIRRISANLSTSDLSQYFASKPEDLIAQANQFLSEISTSWHNDGYPSDWINYLIEKNSNDTTLLDYSLPVPVTTHAMLRLGPIYSTLFATLVGSNMKFLLEDLSDRGTLSVILWSPEVRIFVSAPAFIIVETLLGFYIVTTILLYARRPWRFLPRFPTSIASIIAFFAASNALHEQSSTELSSQQSRHETHRVRSSWRWGYGSFTGPDGRLHIGVDREPLVNHLRQKSLLTSG